MAGHQAAAATAFHASKLEVDTGSNASTCTFAQEDEARDESESESQKHVPEETPREEGGEAERVILQVRVLALL